ncbi:MAG: radical SAM protein [Armatimonadota bacterium]
MARCPFCNIWQMKSSPLPLDVQLGLLKEIRSIGVRYIDFTGGEPLLCQHLPELLREARKLGFITSVTTNCYLYPKRHSEIRGMVDFLGFSINGAHAEEHDAIYGVACFDRMVESIRLAKESGEVLHLHATAIEGKMDQLWEIAEFAHDHNVPLVIFPEFSYCGNGNLPSSHLIELSSIAKQPNVFVNQASLRIARTGGNHITRPICRGAEGAIAITPDGYLAVPCFHAAQSRVPIVGRLKDTISSSDFRREAVGKAGRMPHCEGCQNWCYLNPSLVARPCLLSFLQTSSAIWRFRAMFACSNRPTAAFLRSVITRLSM